MSMSIGESDGVAGQRVPGGVHADRVDQVLQRDHGAGPLGHPQRLAVADQVDQLADQDLQVASGSSPKQAAIAFIRPM